MPAKELPMVDTLNPVLNTTKSAQATNVSARFSRKEKQRRYLLIQNLDAAVKVGVQFSDDGATAAVYGAVGTVTLLPGGSVEFNGEAVPKDGFTIITDNTGNANITVAEIF